MAVAVRLGQRQGVGGAGVSVLVASNLPISSDGNSVFSVGRSSIGMKSFAASVRMGLLSGTIFFSALASAWGSAFGLLASKFSSGSATFGVSVALGAAVSFLYLTGTSGFRLGAVASLAGGGVAVFMAGSWGASTVMGCSFVAGASSVLALVRSPFLLAENTLSAPSFFTVFTVNA